MPLDNIAIIVLCVTCIGLSIVDIIQSIMIGKINKTLDSLTRKSMNLPCKHHNAVCVYESDDGEFERYECPDCGERFGREIPQ